MYDSTEEETPVFDDPMKAPIYSRFGNPAVMAMNHQAKVIEESKKINWNAIMTVTLMTSVHYTLEHNDNVQVNAQALFLH